MDIEQLKAEIEQLKSDKRSLLKLINHDIRAPFNRVFALIQLLELESQDLAASQKEYIQSMYLSILSGLEMITNLRDMREIDDNNLDLELQEFHLADCIHKAIRSFSKQFEIKKLDIKTQINLENDAISSDEYLLKRCIENVLSNAIKFSKDGEEIVVSAYDTASSFFIEVLDYGKGIKENEEHLLFKKFSRLSNQGTAGEGSLGLGLYNTSKILEMLKGSIRLKEHSVHGAKFIIEVPIQ